MAEVQATNLFEANSASVQSIKMPYYLFKSYLPSSSWDSSQFKQHLITNASQPSKETAAPGTSDQLQNCS
jgi:hypothetical protein